MQIKDATKENCEESRCLLAESEMKEMLFLKSVKIQYSIPLVKNNQGKIFLHSCEINAT